MSQVVRLSFLRPHFTRIAEVEQLMDELLDVFASQPGFIQGFRFGYYGHPERNEIGRLTVWTDHAAADRVATSERVIALRSQIALLLHEDPVEHLMEVRGTPRNLP